MKRAYERPEVEKIAFRYRDQVVVASGEAGTEENVMKNPSIGDYVGESGFLQSNCKVYLAESWNWNICSYL